MKKLEIDKDRMLKAAEECPKVKKFCKIMWPEEFEPEDVTRECRYLHECGFLYIKYQKQDIGVVHHDGPKLFQFSEGAFRIEQGKSDGLDHHNFRILKHK